MRFMLNLVRDAKRASELPDAFRDRFLPELAWRFATTDDVAFNLGNRLRRLGDVARI